MGGGIENRASLADAVLWKDNHWALLKACGGNLADALTARPHPLAPSPLRGEGEWQAGVPVIVEIENEAQLEEALAAGVRHILADNQPPERIADWARRAGPEVTIQASGGITPETARAYALAGATLISIGALTHSAPAAPIRCEIGIGAR
jgi:nicotinate-nucleotide pyrophosphorylase (carboxylating)